MTRLAANLSMMFQELPFLDRLDAAAAAGFKAIECVMPYVAPSQELAERLRKNNLAMALFNMPPGDWASGERGFAADPSRVEDFAASIDTTIEYAEATGCKTVHLMAGKIPADADRSQWNAILVRNIRRAADALILKGITIVLEPINTRIDIPGYFYDTTAAALTVIDEVGVQGVKLLYDIYHMQIMEGDLARTIERLLPRIGHVQLADNPGRNEPGTGEINYPWLLAKLDALGYDGWVGCEYKPAGETNAGLGWAKPYLG